MYYKENVRFLIVMAYTVVKLPFALRMIKAAFYAIDEELEDAARDLGERLAAKERRRRAFAKLTARVKRRSDQPEHHIIS